MNRSSLLLISLAGFVLPACAPTSNDGFVATPGTSSSVQADELQDFVFTGLDDDQAYRITLVMDANITPDAAGSASFIDNDANGAADAGASETVGLIVSVQGEAVAPAKTVPAGSDDPAAPSGVFPMGGTITVTVAGVGDGAVYPVLYENGGASTFLEIDADGIPTEAHVVAGDLSVSGAPARLAIVPTDDSTASAGEGVEYTITGLDDAQAYRITLVVEDNVTVRGDRSGLFVDGDDNGAADAGASEAVALITEVNGLPVPGAKTVPAGSDNPAAPTGVFPINGVVTVFVEGVAPGTVYPVAYTNGGSSTFLELGHALVPIEAHGVGGALTIQ